MYVVKSLIKQNSGYHKTLFPVQWSCGIKVQVNRICRYKLDSASHLEAWQVWGLEVVWRAAAPVHDVLVLALASQFTVPVGKPQVVVHHGLAVDAVLQHGMEKRLWVWNEKEISVMVWVMHWHAWNIETQHMWTSTSLQGEKIHERGTEMFQRSQAHLSKSRSDSKCVCAS